MNPTKTLIKIETVQSLGEDFCKQRNGVEAEVYRYEGVRSASGKLSTAIEGLFAFVDKDAAAGRFDLPTASLVKEYLSKARGCCVSLSDHASVQEQLSRGRLSAYDQIIDSLKKKQTQEEDKLRDFQAALDSGKVSVEVGEASRPSGAHVTGNHPGPSIAALRKAETPKEETPKGVEPGITEDHPATKKSRKKK